ncbi:MAG TPA: diacylglycerol kinase family protein, partial [Alphaproteobacteria bacterium]|nr:diacylglycerol kinase family protein [Alphaproteobacteria bacterium]
AVQESGLAHAGLHFLEGDKIAGALREFKQEGVLLGGGDGSFMHAAAEFMDAPGKLGLLPMGTMNLLAQDLKIPVQLNEALKAYAGGIESKAIDIALVNGKPFLCFATIGIVPEAAKLREESREENDLVLIPRLAMFIFPKLDPSQYRRFHLRLDGKRRHLRASSLVISNNLLQDAEKVHRHAFAKKSLQNGLLGIYTLTPRSFWDKFRLLLRVKIGHLKSEPSVVERVARQVEFYSYRGKEAVSLDGEPVDMPAPLTFSIKPKGLTLLVPKPTEETAA